MMANEVNDQGERTEYVKSDKCPNCGKKKRDGGYEVASDLSFVSFQWSCECGSSGSDYYELKFTDTVWQKKGEGQR